MKKLKPMIIVSACLAGIDCKYDGTNNLCPKIAQMVQNYQAIPVCPEVLGSMPIPRPRSEISEGQVINQKGQNITANFQKGAFAALKIAQIIGAKTAILKAKSPSCGFGQIHDGTFSKKLIKGNGIFAQLLVDNKIKIKTEKDI